MPQAQGIAQRSNLSCGRASLWYKVLNVLFQVHTKSPEKWDFNREAAVPFLPLLLLCLRQLQQQIPFPAAPKKDTNTSRDVKNLLYVGVHSMAKSTYRLMLCMEPRWTHTKLELIPSSRVFPLFSIIFTF